MKNVTNNYEIIIVNDGSSDKTQEAIEKLCHDNRDYVKGIQFRSNFGKASALKAGFGEAQGEIIFTMDADLQDDPKEIPRFIAKINEGYDLVSGWKRHRKDSFIKNTSSKFFNFITSIYHYIHVYISISSMSKTRNLKIIFIANFINSF